MRINARFLPALLLPLVACRLEAAFNPAIVAADAQWVVYLDFNELRETTLGRELVSMTEKKVQAEFPQGGPADLRINITKVLTTIGSVTGYGANFSTEPKTLDGTLVIQGTADLRKIAEGLIAQATITAPKEVVEVAGAPFETYALKDEVFIGFPKEPIVIISKSRAQLQKAHEVFKGSSASLAKTPGSPVRALLSPASKAYIVAASVVPPVKGLKPEGPQARILQLANSGAVSIGEENARTVAHVQLVASSDDNAAKLLKIVEGMTAMLSLAETSDKQLAEFINSAAVQRKDRAVTVDLSYSSERLAMMLKALQDAQPQRRVVGPGGPGGPPAPQIPGKRLAEWKLDQAPEGAVASAETLATRKIENVQLKTGSTVILSARREGKGRAFVDLIEIVPMDGSAPPLRFEAENMRHNRFAAMMASFASGRRVIAMPPTSQPMASRAEFEFPGADGNYAINVRYVEESDGKTTLALNVKDPVAEQPGSK
jgi:hypothetical protein